MRSKEAILRNLIHLMTLVVPVLYLFVSKRHALAVLGPLAGLALAADLTRLRVKRLGAVFLRVFGSLLKGHEVDGLTGATHLLIGSALCVSLFDKPIAILALVFATVGDAVASAVGDRIGRARVWGSKSLEGSVACLVVCVCLAALVPTLGIWPDAPAVSWAARLFGALAAAVVELLSVPVDDNLIVPLASGLVMQVLA